NNQQIDIVLKKFISANKKALLKFRKNSWGVFSLFFIVFLCIIAILAYVIAPDNSKNANNGDISISTKNIGFNVLTIKIPSNQEKTNFMEYFTGKNNPDKFIPILSY